MTRDHGVKARLYTFLTRHPGVVFTTAELRRELDIKHSGTVGSALARLRLEHNVQSPVKGSWVYRGDAQPQLPQPVPVPPGRIALAADQLQVIALADNLVVARDKAGRIWVLRVISREAQAGVAA